jgi:hypothetical protein
MLRARKTAKRTSSRDAHVRLADACWIAVALLHKDHPSKKAFHAKEIAERLEKERLTTYPRTSIAAHLSQHCVANVPPTSGRYRLLTRESDGRLRLFRIGDFEHPSRRGKDRPRREDIPARFRTLLDWYQKTYLGKASPSIDPVLAMAGVGKEIWQGIDADQYVDELRSGWSASD